MSTNPRRDLHELIDRLDADAIRRFSSALNGHAARSARQPRPLREADIVLAEAIVPQEGFTDDMIDTIRAWRREGGYA